MVQTWSNSPLGEKKVTAYVGDIRLDVYVHIASANMSADVSFNVNSKIAYIGGQLLYDLHLKNLQSKENSYKLAVTGFTDNCYYRYKESSSSKQEMAKVVMPASSEKDLTLEIVPPYNVSSGDYNFMAVSSQKIAYDARPGEAFDIGVLKRPPRWVAEQHLATPVSSLPNRKHLL